MLGVLRMCAHPPRERDMMTQCLVSLSAHPQTLSLSLLIGVKHANSDTVETLSFRYGEEFSSCNGITGEDKVPALCLELDREDDGLARRFLPVCLIRIRRRGKNILELNAGEVRGKSRS